MHAVSVFIFSACWFLFSYDLSYISSGSLSDVGCSLTALSPDGQGCTSTKGASFSLPPQHLSARQHHRSTHPHPHPRQNANASSST
ncbi:uncharacterized protein J3D65DRAFT_628927 [Phyllosticta citribraziliensis]|uniref:Secreted protein n=1 Tax=Phyllosticta citribraziliensis TaxID=989973 RepID=A0ABR1LJE3_9PEZI